MLFKSKWSLLNVSKLLLNPGYDFDLMCVRWCHRTLWKSIYHDLF